MFSNPMAKVYTVLLFLSYTLTASTQEHNETTTMTPEFFNQTPNLTIESSQAQDGIEKGSTPSFICKLSEPGDIKWESNRRNVTTIKESDYKARFDLTKASRNDSGNYTCIAVTKAGKELRETIAIRVIEPGNVTKHSESVRANATEPAILQCDFQGFPLENFTWMKGNNSESIENLRNIISVIKTNETYYISTLNFTRVQRNDNGTYVCMANDYNGIVKGMRNLFVIDVPQVHIEFTKAVGVDKIYLNWTLNDGNMPIDRYFIMFKENGTDNWKYYTLEAVNVSSTYHVLKSFVKSTTYQLTIIAENKKGSSTGPMQNNKQVVTVKTLDEDPVFVPVVSVKGFTDRSLTLGWKGPPASLKEHVHYYTLMMIDGNQTKEAIHPAEFHDYVFVDLNPATTYQFKIAACNDYTKECGNWSSIVNGTTLDGICSEPLNFTITCRYDNNTGKSVVSASWAPPAVPNGIIIHYKMVLVGVSAFRNAYGKPESVSLGPIDHSAKEDDRKWEFTGVPSNTNYTARIYGVTRMRSPGKEAIANCTMPTTVPDKDDLNLSWKKIQNEGRHFFQLFLPRVSGRNGPICCYRIFVVKLKQHGTLASIPYPNQMEINSYQQVHSSRSGGAYLAEMYDSDHVLSEIFLGDNRVNFNSSKLCNHCIGLRPKPSPTLQLLPDLPVNITNLSTVIPDVTTSSHTITTSTSPTIELTSSINQMMNSSVLSRRKRENIQDTAQPIEISTESGHYPLVDGYLDENSNYTAFMEVLVFGNGENQVLSAYSDYLNPLFGGMEERPVPVEQRGTLGIILQISIALLLIVMVVLIALCILHKYTKRADQAGEENINLRNSIRSLRGRHQLVAASPPDMPPISKTDLLQSYLERHRDSDYGFQHEFELLPDRFTDRTTRASEARENLYKNRYPDIKSYDQTRVRLSQLDGIAGSDYINANFVLGYKERKKFICAQGPMDNTVCDYWRMIWEQHLELILMLTNLEEYSKTKCAKYWPDKDETKNFGDITVEHVRQRTFSDYVVRELKMTKTGERDSRTIIQYHFLVWKDFMAPEHPHAILRFIKRINEAYSLEKGPILVHCSAGVGRTGTLVALDSLLQQLTEEGHVSIFNTVCDLRHQRNFLVQSLKQYIFIYRSLMEMATYGDTEIPINQLKATVDKLRQRDNGKDKCRMEDEYDELVLNSQKISSVLEERKSFSVGTGDENRVKNRSELVIPYDRNRVILTPIPGREHSTYINASFIEGYDNSESFVITQDPLDTTIADFWRMISEQCIATIVMLSDLNEGPRKCPRYWPEDEAVYDHIKVRYIQSESCPYYTRRELCVINTKTDETNVVIQYQYHGWPTVEGEVPEVTRGLIELVDQTLFTDAESTAPLVVHCSSGSDRSSMFVALSILVQQLRTEKRVDIFTTTKKLRSQRHGMISSYAQYEFLHRAIMNYADLHNLTDDEPVS